VIRRLTISVAIALLLFFPTQSPQLPQSQEKIRSKVNEVIVPVTVTNKTGDLILDLSQKDFHVFDNGVEQSITTWDLGGDPLAVALVIDTSSRIKAMAPGIHRMASIFTETVMALNGEAAVITYDSETIVRQDFTQDHDAVGNAIANVKFQVPEFKLYDGMARAVALLAAQPLIYRRIMLVIGESQDNESKANLGQVVRDAAHANISIYAVGTSSVAADIRGVNKGVTPLKIPGLPPITTGQCLDNRGNPCYDLVTPAVWLLERGTNELKSHQLEIAAAATGGIHYRAFRDKTIASALDRIGSEIHAQYIITYTPTKEPAAGFNEIKVTVSRPKLTVRTRPGYYVLPPK
jgi:Ca-activated chloride channel family protein